MDGATENKLAAMGLPVFPLAFASKVPPRGISSYVASTHPEVIKRLFYDPILDLRQPYNVGIFMRGFIGIDVDMKEGRRGDDSFLEMELQGLIFPHTFMQRTPTGGSHLVYSLPKDTTVGNSVQSLAPGIDVRGSGGYLVGAGSTVPEGSYSANWADIVRAPQWLLARIARTKLRAEKVAGPSIAVDVSVDYARERGRNWLREKEGVAKGLRDATAYALACHLKNLGVTQLDAFDLLNEIWAPRCSPSFASQELMTPVENAYRYAKEKNPVYAPEFAFDKIPEQPKKKVIEPHIEKLNKEYAFIIEGGSHHIIFETTNAMGKPIVQHFSEITFHRKLAAHTLLVGDKRQPVSRLWMNSLDRRQFDGFCFSPGHKFDKRYYNLFRGFAVKSDDPTDDNPFARKALAMFLEHSLNNICQGDVALNDWLIAYFAHIFQRPWEKPGVALVFRGKKGVGKNALIERIGALLGSHFMLTAEQRYLSGNFNAHLESLIMLVLDEAFWSGQKDIEGLLKHLITGTTHVIERKGKEPYSVASCLRTVVIGNEKWLVPATEDERRYAVFDVGDERQQDRAFFESMREGLEAGGYGLLLRYLLAYDLKKVNVMCAPNTRGLSEQKMHSLGPIGSWWQDCLSLGYIVGSSFLNDWPVTISTEEFRDAYYSYRRKRAIAGRAESAVQFGRILTQQLPACSPIQKRLDDGRRIWMYTLPSLQDCRRKFEQTLKATIKWEE